MNNIYTIASEEGILRDIYFVYKQVKLDDAYISTRKSIVF